MKNTIKKIYEFITQLVILLEDELESLRASNKKNTISTQKNIADILNKLVNLISQLNKVSPVKKDKNFSKSDQDILDKFIAKIKKEAK